MGLLLDKTLTGMLLMFRYFQHNLLDAADDGLRFRPMSSGWKPGTCCLPPPCLAPKTAHRQADLVHRLDYRAYIVHENQPRHVQHNAGPHACAHIARAGGQIIARGESIVQPALNFRINLI